MSLSRNIMAVHHTGRSLKTTLGLLCVALFFFDAFVLLYGISNGINDFLFSFRQTQTALTAYWLIKEPHTFAYITPVLGAPWSMPFEYPIYQWLAVLLTKVGIPLVAAGRLVSFAAFVGCLVPIWTIARDLRISKVAFLIVAIVYLSCPFYVYWSRTFMIETTALFFSLCWLAGVIKSRVSSTPLLWLATLGCGCLAVLTKSTTFLSIGTIAGAIYLHDLFIWLRRDRSALSAYRLVRAGLVFLIPIVIGSAWVVASDYFKAQNAFGAYLNSEALRVWNFGSLAQRFALTEPIMTSLRETFGYVGVIIPLLIALELIRSKYRTTILFAVAGYLSTFFIFTNLHIVHTYYQSANAVFACIAAGLTLASMLENGWRKTAVAALVCILLSQGHYFREFFWRAVATDNVDEVSILTAKFARDATKPDQSLLIFGEEWSSRTPFYSERKSLAVPSFTQQPLFDKIIADPQSFLGSATLGGVIDCRLPSPSQTYRPEQMAKIDQFMASRKIIFQNGYCRFAAP